MKDIEDVFKVEGKNFIAIEPKTEDDHILLERILIVDRLNYNLGKIAWMSNTALNCIDYLSRRIFTVDFIEKSTSKAFEITNRIGTLFILEKTRRGQIEIPFEYGMYFSAMEYIYNSVEPLANAFKKDEDRYYPIIPVILIIGLECHTAVDDSVRLAMSISKEFYQLFKEGFEFFDEKVINEFLKFSENDDLTVMFGKFTSVLGLISTWGMNLYGIVARSLSNKLKEIGGYILGEEPTE